jgi:cytochrome c oxidase cbb3-type subunit 4
MDVNTLRIAVTVAGLALFLVLVAHTWSRRRVADHEAAALLPFADDDEPVPAAGANHNQGVKP